MQWVTSYFGNRILRHVRQDMRHLAGSGFHEVVHTFSENDLFYASATMQDLVRATQDAGLSVQIDPWGVAGIFGGEAFSRWILEEPELQQRGPSGRLLGGACLNHPGLREKMARWLDAAARTGADRVFWDEPHWSPRGPRNPGGELCVCEHCLAAARQWCEQQRVTVPAGTAASAPTGGFPEALFHPFRAASVLRLLADLCRLARERGLPSSICVLPLGVLDQPVLDWKPFAGLPGVELFGTDPYWQAFGIDDAADRDRFIDTNCSLAQAAAREAGVATMLWIQAFRVPVERQADLLEGARRLLGNAPDLAAIWGFEACAHMSELACGQAYEFWERLLELVRETSAGQRARQG